LPAYQVDEQRQREGDGQHAADAVREPREAPPVTSRADGRDSAASGRVLGPARGNLLCPRPGGVGLVKLALLRVDACPQVKQGGLVPGELVEQAGGLRVTAMPGQGARPG